MFGLVCKHLFAFIFEKARVTSSVRCYRICVVVGGVNGRDHDITYVGKTGEINESCVVTVVSLGVAPGTKGVRDKRHDTRGGEGGRDLPNAEWRSLHMWMADNYHIFPQGLLGGVFCVSLQGPVSVKH